MKKIITNKEGITLISLIITIVVLVILAGVALNMALGENGIITKSKETKKLQIVAEAKEKIGADILSAQIESIERNEELEQAQIEDIISKYGVLQADGDTIILNNSGYEISLLDIYNGTVTSTGSYTELKAENELLKQQLADSSKNESEANKELTELKTILAGTNATEDKVLKDYKAYSNGQLIAGTMKNFAGQTLTASDANSDDTSLYLTIPQAGYYDATSKISTLNSNVASGQCLFSGMKQYGYWGTYAFRNPYINSNYCTLTDHDGSSGVDQIITITRPCVLKSLQYARNTEGGAGVVSLNGNTLATISLNTITTIDFNTPLKVGDKLSTNFNMGSSNATLYLCFTIE